MQILRQSTAVDVLIGPFLDETDGNTEETGLTIAQADVRLSKNGQTLAQKNDNTSAAHDADGLYNCELDATDTNTVGQLDLYVHVAGALYVRHSYQIIEEAAYDAIFASSASPATAAALATAQADLDTLTGADGATLATSQPNYAPATSAALATAQTDLDTLTGTDGATLATSQPNFTPAVAGDEMALEDGAITAAKIASDAITAAKVAADVGTEIATAVWASGTRTLTSIAGLGIALAAKLTAYVQLLARKDAAIATDNATELTEINADGGSGAGAYANTTDALEAVRDHIGDGTNLTEAGGTGDHLTAIDLPNQTMDITGNITGNLSGSVGSVTGNVGGNVTGSVGSLATQAKADVNAEVDGAIETYHLDHLLAATYDPASKPGAADALLNEMVENDGGVSRFTANALEQAPSGTGASAADIADAVWEEAIADHSGTAGSTAEQLAAAGAAGDPWATALPGSYTSGQAGKIVGDNLNATVSSRASQTSVDDVPTNAELATALDALPTAAENADAVLDEALSGHTTAGTLGKAVADIETDATAILEDTGTTLQAELDGIQADTEDIQTRLPAALVSGRMASDAVAISGSTVAADAVETNIGNLDDAVSDAVAAPAAALTSYDPPTKAELDAAQASIESDIAGVQTTADAIEADTQDLQSRTPAALVGGRMDASLGAVNGDATAAANLEGSTETIIRGTVDATVTPTTTEFEADDITEATADHYIGRVIIFRTGALAGQATDITDYALNGGKGHFTVTALTEAPGNDDTFVIV